MSSNISSKGLCGLLPDCIFSAITNFSFSSGGIWQAILGAYHANQPGTYNDYYFKPSLVDTWENRNYGYTPVGGSYDSGTTSVINNHLSEINNANIDFILLDQTNNLYADRKYIIRRALKVCEAVSSSSTSVKFAIAIGGIQFSGNPATIETEAKNVWKLFLDGGVATHDNLDKCNGTNKYFNTTASSTKPLLVVYANTTQRASWESYGGSKTYANKFNIKWAQGTVKSSNIGSYAASDYVGWAFVDGAIKNNDTMAFIPGWDNHGASSTPAVPRNNGVFYKEKGWERVVCDGAMPDTVVVASYNEYGEETAVAPSNTSALPSNKQWSSTTQYWNITKDFNTAHKNGTTTICN